MNNNDDGCLWVLLGVILIPIFGIISLILSGIGIIAALWGILAFINFLFDVNQDLGFGAVFLIFCGVSALFGGGYTVVTIFFK